MGLALGIGVYFVLWWTLFMAVLPWGVKTQVDQGDIVPGSERSAPVVPHLLRKVIANTILAGVVWALADLAYIYLYLRR